MDIEGTEFEWLELNNGKIPEYINEFNESLNFRTVKKSDDYTTSVCPQNRFSVMWNTNTQENKIDTLIIKTNDIVNAEIFRSLVIVFNPFSFNIIIIPSFKS